MTMTTYFLGNSNIIFLQNRQYVFQKHNLSLCKSVLNDIKMYFEICVTFGLKQLVLSPTWITCLKQLLYHWSYSEIFEKGFLKRKSVLLNVKFYGNSLNNSVSIKNRVHVVGALIGIQIVKHYNNSIFNLLKFFIQT